MALKISPGRWGKTTPKIATAWSILPQAFSGEACLLTFGVYLFTVELVGLKSV